jgi:hypothetical protein
LVELQHMGVQGGADRHRRRGLTGQPSRIEVGGEIMQGAAGYLIEVALADRWVGVVGGVVHSGW